MITFKPVNTLKYLAGFLILSAAAIVTSCDTPTNADERSDMHESDVSLQAYGNVVGMNRHVVLLKPGNIHIATDIADEVYRLIDLGENGVVVFGQFSDQTIKDLGLKPEIRLVEPVVLYGVDRLARPEVSIY